MAMQFNQIVPFGRTLTEYRSMFRLVHSDLQRTILGCADGPASFNAEMFARGHRVVSVDPIYQCSGDRIKQRFDAVVDSIIGQVETTLSDWVWSFHESPASLRRTREQAMARFLLDYITAAGRPRYIAAALPKLPFPNAAFELALCSHFLFLYSDHLTTQFHLESIDELIRVASEVRIFPLLDLSGQPSIHVKPVLDHAHHCNVFAEIVSVPYEFQRGGNKMLRLWRPPSDHDLGKELI